MQQQCLIPGTHPREIYVIVRVFDLAKGQIGVKVVVDPVAMQHRGELELKPSGWIAKVRP